MFRYNSGMEFIDWVNEVINTWVKTGRSESQLAKVMGMSQGTLNAYKNGTRPKPKNKVIINKFIAYFQDDLRVYEIFGETPPLTNGPAVVFLINHQYKEEDLAPLSEEIEDYLDSITGLNHNQRQEKLIECYVQRGFVLVSKG